MSSGRLVRGILGDVDRTMPGTWVGHGLASLALYLGGGVASLLLGRPVWLLGFCLAGLVLLLSLEWVLAGLVAAALALIVVAGLPPIQGACVGALAGLVYYLLREKGDKEKKEASEGGYTDKARLDKVGDTVGPALVAVASVFAVLLEWMSR
jgi:hypothetical protein